MTGPASRVLSSSQLATLAEVGEERTAQVGETLFEIGDETYPFIAVVEGEAAILDGASREIVRHGASGFLGEMNLLSGQTVFLTAVEPLFSQSTKELSSEVAELHGDEGRLDAVTLADGTRLPLSYLFLFLGATPCTDWLGDTVARDSNGFVLTGPDAGADGLFETSVPGVYAAGDVRAGSIKRCATAVGEGATIMRFVHEYLSPAAA